MAGQGTAALELMEDEPELDALIAPVGGGGLLAGCATIAKELRPQVRVFGAEPEAANDTYLSFQAGKRIEIPAQNTIADGLRSPAPGKLTFPVIRRHVEGIVLVTEEEIRATVKFVLLRMKVLTEPSGAVSAAAVLHHKMPAGLQRIGVIVSGGNVDFEQLATY
jgi:threonine dehydratase